MPDEHKAALLASLRMVDAVVIGHGIDEGLDFRDAFLRLRPEILAVTEDDKYGLQKRALCDQIGARYVVLPKTKPQFAPISTTEIVRNIRAPREAPLRVDFAGGWLDVPGYAREGGYVVNCAVSPLVSLVYWPYEKNSGLGGSGAWALLNGIDGVKAEKKLGAGWQDPAVIAESGLCVWRSGKKPDLEVKTDGAFLSGKMALYWTGKPHDTPAIVGIGRDYESIGHASRIARNAVWNQDIEALAEAVRESYAIQRAEGMAPLPGDSTCRDSHPPHVQDALSWKYCGAGHGGYALYIFPSSDKRNRACEGGSLVAIEPFIKYDY